MGEGRTDVRASETGGDEVTELHARSTGWPTISRAARRRSAASDRARRQLLADVSHELMTPLSAIRGYIETLSMPELTLDDPTRQRYLDIVHEETHKLEAIIGDLLDLARLEGGADTLKPTTVNVDRSVRRALPTATARDGRARHPARDRAARSVRRRSGATRRGSSRRYRTWPRTRSATRRRRAHRPARRARGRSHPHHRDRQRPRHPAEHLPHIFDRFYKADAARAGTTIPSGSGLGLSIVQAIVARHHGEVSASNAEDGGAQIELLLHAS